MKDTMKITVMVFFKKKFFFRANGSFLAQKVIYDYNWISSKNFFENFQQSGQLSYFEPKSDVITVNLV